MYAASESRLDRLVELLATRRRWFVLTGAGCSTESGIPDYRDADGEWKHRRPMQYREFVGSAAARQCYWARSFVGWRRIAAAEPNAAHRALAALESGGRVSCLVTQNVDRLHARAGSRNLIDLHGRLDRVECLGCRSRFRREAFQRELERLNPGPVAAPAAITPDGDAELLGGDVAGFRVPSCPRCGGVLKPEVVFFGEQVPKPRVERAFRALEEADAMLVAGSSLMVFSGYRFARAAAARGVPLVLVNLGRTRADGEATVKVEGRCGEVLQGLVEALNRSRPGGSVLVEPAG
jgi:NAD-dependent SIR2 family protein deacetylase